MTLLPHQALDFAGVDGEFKHLSLHLNGRITAKRKKNLEIYQNNEILDFLKVNKLTLEANSGPFIIQNKGDQKITIRFQL